MIADLDAKALDATGCGISGGAGKIPFICFDLSGGANIAGSNVLMGKEGGQLDFLTTAGYSKLGIPGNMTPNLPTFTDQTFGLAFHTDSAFLRGMKTRAATTTASRSNGTIIAARSENDTGNNPHNPMYGIYKAGADGELLTLIGSHELRSRAAIRWRRRRWSISRCGPRRWIARATSPASWTPASSARSSAIPPMRWPCSSPWR